MRPAPLILVLNSAEEVIGSQVAMFRGQETEVARLRTGMPMRVRREIAGTIATSRVAALGHWQPHPLGTSHEPRLVTRIVDAMCGPDAPRVSATVTTFRDIDDEAEAKRWQR